MSSPFAIAAATATLRNLLSVQIPQRDAELADLEVTTQPPDLARKGVTKAQLNLYLYQTTVNAGWRNLDNPRQVRPGETGLPPLALNLHYLLTAYGRDTDDETISHRVLGGAMSVLHDHAVLGRAEIGSALAGSGLDEQFERVRITPSSLPMDEMSKLWTALQTPYRVSAGYEVTVVLIDSLAGARAALPVLKRGADDRGAKAVAGRAPVLAGVRYPRSQPAARLGDDISITGSNLTIANARLRFTSTRLAVPIELAPSLGDRADEIKVHLPSIAEDATALTTWAPGLYTLALIVQEAGGIPLVSNEIAFALAPIVTLTPTAAGAGTLNLTATCVPRIASGQRTLLMLGDRPCTAASIDVPPPAAGAPSSAKFTVPTVAADTYVVRLRVDGIDSMPVVSSGTPPVPSFDPAQQVVVS